MSRSKSISDLSHSSSFRHPCSLFCFCTTACANKSACRSPLSIIFPVLSFRSLCSHSLMLTVGPIPLSGVSCCTFFPDSIWKHFGRHTTTTLQTEQEWNDRKGCTGRKGRGVCETREKRNKRRGMRDRVREEDGKSHEFLLLRSKSERDSVDEETRRLTHRQTRSHETREACLWE